MLTTLSANYHNGKRMRKTALKSRTARNQYFTINTHSGHRGNNGRGKRRTEIKKTVVFKFPSPESSFFLIETKEKVVFLKVKYRPAAEIASLSLSCLIVLFADVMQIRKKVFLVCCIFQNTHSKNKALR